MSEQQPNRSVRGAELQNTSTAAARVDHGIHGHPEQLEKDGESTSSPSQPLASNFSFLPPYTGISWSFPSSVAGKWEKLVSAPGWGPDCTLFSADSSSYPEAQRADICAEAKPCQGGMFWKASAVVCNIFSFLSFFFFFNSL